jgi:hypothetical protein
MTDPTTKVEEMLAELRARIHALGPDAIAGISRSAKGRAPQAKVRLFRDGLISLDLRLIPAIAAAVSEVEAARAADGNVTQFPTAGGGKVKKAKAATAAEAVNAAPETAGGAPPEADGSVPAAAIAPEAAMVPDAAGEASEAAAMVPERDGSASSIEGGVDELRAKAAALATGDIAGAKGIIDAAVALPRMDELEKDGLLGAMKRALGGEFKMASLNAIWARAASALRPSPEALAAADAAVNAAEKEAERARLAPLVGGLANRLDLIEHAADVAQALGVVGERKAIKANYIAMSSRVLAEPRVLSILRTGLTAAGKSFLMNTTACLFPDECIKVVTTGSPKALVYLVGEDSRALAHKIVLLHETAGFIASSDADDNPSAALVRELMTGGRIRHLVAEKDDSGRFATREIEVEGPISLITTSARANLDPEMENRFLIVPTDESPQATRLIQLAQLSGVTRHNAERAAKAVEELVAFQRWLQSEAGVRVIIPDELMEASVAVGGLPLTVQARRDVPLFKLAVMACAAIHMAQRKRDARGRVIAEFADYEAAHDAIDGFIAASYSTALKPPETAVLATIEILIAEDQKRRAAIEGALKPGEGVPMDHLPSNTPKARLTYDMIAARLQIKSRNTLARRVKALRLARAISIVTEHQGYGPRSSVWELLIPAARTVAMKDGRFMPPPSAVAEMLADPAARRKRLDRIVAETGALPDLRTHEDNDGGGDSAEAGSAAPADGNVAADGVGFPTDEDSV